MNQSLPAIIEQSLNRFANKTAIIQHRANGESETLSFDELRNLAGRLYGLVGSDARPEECVGIYMQRSVEHVASIIACLYSNSPYTTINNLFSARQILRIASTGKVKKLLCDNAGLLKLRSLTQDEPGRKLLAELSIVHIHSGAALPPLYQQTVTLLGEFATISSVSPPELPPTSLPVPKLNSADTAKLVLFTSGSTGAPKGVMINGTDLTRRVESESKYFKLQEDDVLLSILPFSFDVGCNQLYTSLANGCTLVILNSWTAKDILSALEKYNITGVSGVPSLWLSIIESNQEPPRTVDETLRYITISGGDMASSDRLSLRRLFPKAQIFKTYGQTETFRTCILRAENFDEKHDSIGKPVHGVKLYLVDEDGNELEKNKVGEVVHRGVGTMLGYLGDQDATRTKLRSLPSHIDDTSEPVIYTGDLGRLDEAGYLHLLGRKDRMFKVRGNRVYPEEIEKELCSHPNIIEAVAAYDRQRESITVHVRRTTEATLTPKDISKFISSRVPSYMAPTQCLIHEEFPRTASGKTDIQALLAEPC